MPKKSSVKSRRSNVKKATLKDIQPVSSKLTAQVFKTDNSLFKSAVAGSIIGGIIGLVINVNALLWLQKLDTIDCACSEHWMREYIKTYVYVIVPVFCINLLINLYIYFINTNPYIFNNPIMVLYRVFTFILGLFGIANIFIAVVFINKLKEINCECSEDIKREVYWIYNIVLITIICLTLLFMLISIVLPVFLLSRG